MKKIIGFVLMAVGAIHGLGVVVGLSKGGSPAVLLVSAIIIGLGIFLVKTAKKTTSN